MGKGNMKTKAMTMAVAMSMVAGLCPATVFAAETSAVAKDGTYTKTAHVSDTEEEGWSEYDVEVALQIAGGKITGINVTPGSTYDSESDSYFNWAKDGRTKKGVTYPGYTSLVGKDATEETISSWDAVSGATCTSKGVKEAATAAIKEAIEAGAVVEVNTAELEQAIAAAKVLKESDYTADSWKAMQEKLTAAETALSKKESQDAVDKAKNELNDAVKALKKAEVTSETYVLMNIPYAQFYAADGVEGADSVSSATK